MGLTASQYVSEEEWGFEVWKKNSCLSHAFQVIVLISDEFEKVDLRVVCGHGPCTFGVPVLWFSPKGRKTLLLIWICFQFLQAGGFCTSLLYYISATKVGITRIANAFDVLEYSLYIYAWMCGIHCKWLKCFMRSRGLISFLLMNKKELECLRKLMELKSLGFCQISRSNQGSCGIKYFSTGIAIWLRYWSF